MNKRERTCCFTGHRNIRAADVPVVMQRTEVLIKQLVAQGVVYFAVGGALGYDTLTAELLFRLRDTNFPQIKVILVSPFDGFTATWSEAKRTGYDRRLPQYDKVVQAAEEGSRDAYLLRDRILVDNSAYCICYCTRNSGGTAYTVRYAQRRGIPVYNTADIH